jgi:hypothetical protein
MKFSVILGKIRTEWVGINGIYNRATSQFAHRLCTCQSQTLASQNQLAEWPFKLIILYSQQNQQVPLLQNNCVKKG